VRQAARWILGGNSWGGWWGRIQGAHSNGERLKHRGCVAASSPQARRIMRKVPAFWVCRFMGSWCASSLRARQVLPGPSSSLAHRTELRAGGWQCSGLSLIFSGKRATLAEYPCDASPRPIW
jgi:hypothetical protein